ncbi:MAG: diguanylate cyclase [Clostridia bacterium]|nr:diguanylate cyclase [Clostridia bacterium]
MCDSKNVDSKNVVDLLKALEKAIETQNMTVQKECHDNLSRLYEGIGNFEEAYNHFKAYDALSHQLSTEKENDEVKRIRIRFDEETKRNEAEIDKLRNVELKNKTMELKKTLKNLALIGQIGQKLTSSTDMDEIFDILRNSIYALMTVDVFGLALYKADEEKIIYRYFEEKGRPMPLLEIDIHDRMSLASYCVIEKKDLYIQSFDDEFQLYLPKHDYFSIGDNHDETTLCIIYCRLIAEEGCIGLITMQSYKPYEYTANDFEVIKALASYVAIAISNAQKKNIILEKAKQLEYLSYNDSLTGVYNRRYFNETVARFQERNCINLGLIIGDMNHLKHINDNFGHVTGDHYLVEVASILRLCSATDLVFRIGGDEFAIIIENANIKMMKSIMDSIRLECDRFRFDHVPLSVALGYDIKISENTAFEDVFANAESNMYEEKNRYHK